MRITLYDFGKMVVDGESHTKDVIVHADLVEGLWSRKDGHYLAPGDVEGGWKVRTGYAGWGCTPRPAIS